MQQKTSVLIVSYNTRELTVNCIRSVLTESCSERVEVVVVDNASIDGSAEAIAKEFPQVKLIRHQDNLGFARANNLAAQNADGEYLLLLNPDTVVLDRGVDRLVEFAAERTMAGIWGGRTIFADGSLNPKSCWRFMSLWSIFVQAVGVSSLFRSSRMLSPEDYGGWQRDSERQVDFVSGCFLLIKRELWDRLEGFDERFFMYGEEADLCYRARRLGARPLFTPLATIVHYGGASEVAQPSKIMKLLAGKVTFIDKHWPAPKKWLALQLLKLHSLVRLLGYELAAHYSGATEHRERAAHWREVWVARHVWELGYARAGLHGGELNRAGSD